MSIFLNIEQNSMKLQPYFHAACLFLLSWLQILGKQKVYKPRAKFL